MEQFTYRKDAYWGEGHWIISHREHGVMGRASSFQGKWSALDWEHVPTPSNPGRPALADGLSTRRDVALLLLAVMNTARRMEAETSELLRQTETHR